MEYLAFVMPQDPGWGFSAPDVEGFTALVEAADLEAATAAASHVLEAHLAALVAAGGALPTPRTAAQLRADPALAEDWGESQGLVVLRPVLI